MIVGVEMKKANKIRKIILVKVAIFFALVLVVQPAVAEDLPIDIDEIGRQGARRVEVIALHRDIDLFNEASDLQLEAYAARRVRTHEEAKQDIFDRTHVLSVPDPIETLRNAAIENNLFAEPMRSRTFTPSEDTEMPMWIVITILTGAAVVGLLIAIAIRNKKGEGKRDVHNYHT